MGSTRLVTYQMPSGNGHQNEVDRSCEPCPGGESSVVRRVGASPWIVSDELWERIEPLLPERERELRYPGRKPLPDRQVLCGILCVLSRPSVAGAVGHGGERRGSLRTVATPMAATASKSVPAASCDRRLRRGAPHVAGRQAQHIGADVHSRPGLGHGSRPPARRHTSIPRTTSPTLSYTAIESRLPMGGRVVAGLRAAKFFEPSNGDKLTAIPGTPAPADLTKDQLRPTLGG